jgi:hypothetical protein
MDSRSQAYPKPGDTLEVTRARCEGFTESGAVDAEIGEASVKRELIHLQEAFPWDIFADQVREHVYATFCQHLAQ